jgi:flagellar biosynthesis chaperone FliJ
MPVKKFKFTLETVLAWKRSKEEDALLVMGKAMRARQEAAAALEYQRRHLGALLGLIRQAREGASQAWSQAAYIREVARCENLCQKRQEALNATIIAENKAREAYLACRREAETLLRLKEKRAQLHKKDAQRVLEAELEEIMLSRYDVARQSNTGTLVQN